ncbi:unnamed protein product [Toxocara canis]|uniref:non-specific serine/threonine protein kinase n=1 Tax=Toxocara canis TaxID=6265 RepID=A0A183UPU7_TOXCA|nr:unnamed protein product [Toxocara canis]
MTCVLLAHSESNEVRSTILPSTILLHYNYEFTTLANIKDKLLSLTKKSSVRYFGLHIQNKTTNVISLSGVEKSVINHNSLRFENSSIRIFFRSFIVERMLSEDCFIDFFVSHPIREATQISHALQFMTTKRVSVRFVHRFLSDDISPHVRNIVEVYFNFEKLMRTKNEVAPSTRLPSATDAYDRIRVVGRGSFGMAILYRRKDDDSLVILKEINMLELTTQERQLALNEVSLLSKLDHPHIISYYDSFEENGILMIEMEYAEGGTLAQLLARQEVLLEEVEVMRMFEQMLSAVSYLHDNNILHRDLKTANIFLTKDNDVKVGDFGISRMMGTETRMQGAQTVVGTPYYISPEMCEGKPYNEKSDIWALGCILYEMACLQKTFEGTNLPALIKKIVKGEYDQVRGPYSQELKLLVREMLKLDPDQRPTAKDVLDIVRRNRSNGRKRRNVTGDAENQSDEGISQNSARSAVYKFDVANITLSPITTLATNIKIKQAALSERHYMVVTAERTVYAWGDNGYGQLGLGDRKFRSEPVLVDSLTGKCVAKVAVGETFSLFCTDRGTALFCGNGKYSGDGVRESDVLRPNLIDSLLRVDVIDIACGDEHAVTLADGGKVFVWGNGLNGRLGTGNTNFVDTATQIEIPTQQMVVNVRCGPDATVLLTNSGSIIAMGSNRCNKLNLNHREGFFSNVKVAARAIEESLTPASVKAFPSRVVDVRLGMRHSGVLLESGNIHFFGENSCGELGLGHKNPACGAHRPVKALLSKTCLMIGCGDGFSMAGTADNELYFWGSKGQQTFSRLTVEDLEMTRTSSRGTDPTDRADAKSMPTFKQSRKGAEKEELIDHVILQPSIVLRLEANDNEKTFITLSSLVCCKRNVMVIIETSLLQEQRRLPSNRSSIPRLRHARRLSAPELKEATHIETWIQRELDDAEILPIVQSRCSKTRSLTGSEEASYIPQCNSKTRSPEVSNRQLLAEIENLRTEINSGHEKKMFELQTKLSELQARQQQQLKDNYRPPVYVMNKKSVLRNKLFENTASRACSLL